MRSRHHDIPLRRHEQHDTLHVPAHWTSQEAVCPFQLNATKLELHDPHAQATYHWGSRQHRKHRYPHIQSHAGKGPARKWWKYRVLGLDRGIVQDVQNISWWIAQLFLWGSMCWCVNGWFLFLPVGNENVDLYVSGYTALAGGTLFWIGAYLSVVEALNTGVEINFAHEVLEAAHHDLEAASGGARHAPRPSHHQVSNGHQQPQQSPLLPQPIGATTTGGGFEDGSVAADGQGMVGGAPVNGHTAANGCAAGADLKVEDDTLLQKQRWRWWGFKWHDLGYWAVFIQFIGATLFEISVIMGVPHLLPEESKSNYGTWDAVFWSPQAIGAWGFVLSAMVFMGETQSKWWKPSLLKIGWQVSCLSAGCIQAGLHAVACSMQRSLGTRMKLEALLVPNDEC